MAFEKGNKLAIGHGRPAGSINRHNRAFKEALIKNNFDVCEALLWIYKEAVMNYQSADENRERIPYLRMALDAAQDIAGYVMPKLKAVEVIQEKPSELLNPIEKLAIAKESIPMLEEQAKKYEEKQ